MGSSHVGTGHRHGKHHHAAHSATPQALDPVSGMIVNPDTAAGSFEHRGVTYYFCSAHCLQQFRADPEKYLKSAPATAPQSAAKGTLYTCPMHPDIVRDAPGSCPICGTALVPIGGAAEADDSSASPLCPRAEFLGL